MTCSVVMATYNGSAYVQEQLTSILEGHRVPDELIVVDDLSTDGTVDIVRNTLAAYPQVRFLLLQNDVNIGASKTFLKGIAQSTGDVVFLADQDDRWAPEKVARMMVIFQKRHDTCMAYSDGTITDAALGPDGRTIFSSRSKAHLERGADRDPHEVAVDPDIKGCTMALNGSFARDLVGDSDPDVALYWGHDHWLALMALGTGRVHVVPEQLILHRFHGRNTSSAVRFNALSIAHWRKYWRAARKQTLDHFTERYRRAVQQAERIPHFSPALLGALRDLLAVSMRRRTLAGKALPGRLRDAFRLYREGIYHRYYNGALTFLRDVLVRPVSAGKRSRA